MAKRRAQLFPRLDRESVSTGKVRVFSHADELSKAMGQAKTLIFHGRVYSVSTTGRVIFKVSQNSFSGIAPRDDGTSVSTTGTTTYTAAGVISFAVTADTMFNVECTAEVDDTGAASTQSVEFSLDVTMIEA